jgi:hypothetical protein
VVTLLVQAITPTSQLAHHRLVRGMVVTVAAIPHRLRGACALKGHMERVSLTNLCGQLVVTGILFECNLTHELRSSRR